MLTESEKKSAIHNYENIMDSVESAKIELVAKINDWSLDAQLNIVATISLPLNIFDVSSEWQDFSLGAKKFKGIFVQKIWDEGVRKTIKRVFDVAKASLVGRQVSVTLLSGGSSNIKWLEKLVVRDFKEFIGAAAPISVVGSFQEIVAKGLAIECVRRNCTESPEFKGVTYNPLKLALGPDGKQVEYLEFKSLGDAVECGGKEGDLISSASSLFGLIDKPLRWKVKLMSPPKQELSYYFLKNKVDENDLAKEAFNISSTKVFTKGNPKFEKAIKVEIVVGEDGTVRPKFIYQSANFVKNEPEIYVEGEPFAIDATSFSMGDEARIDKYIGFDFGTSHSSLVVLERGQIDFVQANTSSIFDEVSEFLNDVPAVVYPCLARYLSCSAKSSDAERAWRESIEAVLTFIAYCLLSEEVAKGRSVAGLLKGYQHRSAGPLKGLITQLSHGQGHIAARVKDGLLGAAWIDSAIDDFNNDKHNAVKLSPEKRAEMLVAFLRLLTHSIEGVLLVKPGDVSAGKFRPNSFSGSLFVWDGGWPYSKKYRFESGCSLAVDALYLLVEAESKLICLSPFIFSDEADGVAPKFMVFDKDKAGSARFKAIGLDSFSNIPDAAEAVGLLAAGGTLFQAIQLDVLEEV
ncbi:MAG: hypothetical protein REI12_07275 [Pedobacter sp.]|nr:hypothetical protein [Pedobacter sp.]